MKIKAMTIRLEEARYLLAVIQADDANNRENNLDREPCFEDVEAKLVAMIADYEGRL